MAIDVFVADEQADQPVDVTRWAALAESVARAEGPRGDVELSVLFVDEAAITALNERHLGRSGPTDVLAFPIEDELDIGGRSPDGGGPSPGWGGPGERGAPVLLGDVVICPAVARRNAGRDEARTFEDEVALLIVHGILHLIGMDHETDEDATEMEARELDLLTQFHRKTI